MKDQIKQIEQLALSEISASANDRNVLEALRIKYLGRKGAVTELFKKMAELPPAEKPEAGALLNLLKSAVVGALDEKLRSADGFEEEKERVDVTLPGIPAKLGHVHPITKTIDEICQIFVSIGFRVVEGPEIETEYYNFEALNIPLEHPSRDGFDTFYLKGASSQGQVARNEKFLLRSHTSPVQTRFMEKNKPPFSIIVPGKVYRPDARDASHSFMFHQIEGLVAGKRYGFPT